MTDGRTLQTLAREESLRLLGGVAVGRVVFTRHALPAIRPVNHLLEDDKIIIRIQPGSALGGAVGADGGTVVAYEADMIDPAEHLGWSVIVIGRATHITDEKVAERYRQSLRPWVSGTFDDIVMITAEMVDGFRLVRDDTAQRDPAVP
ncbi:MAG TPA: pyridoxamine 5'-phosphate oxidase family protein, partial [Streptosporangiaceae bacterium]